MEQPLPAEMYVDTDQLNELKLFGKVKSKIFLNKIVHKNVFYRSIPSSKNA